MQTPGSTELDGGVPIIGTAGACIERAVPGQEIEAVDVVAGIEIGGWCASRHPDASIGVVEAIHSIGSAVPLRAGTCTNVIGRKSDDPPVIGPVVAVRGPRNVDDSVYQGETRTLVFPQGIKRNLAVT